ncbi:hypothetical protein PMIN01_11157 [Paraphaeosphaeria minitans]|uniref:Uncharacterized protein n=1 Tax=Paraphaeosphaeria minitans TaxID=565426 RepID=A0A9P6KL62_9PLEO|nr:hypothetical protein PMIN01_11157 [Paraphaeosphaeria minitans]
MRQRHQENACGATSHARPKSNGKAICFPSLSMYICLSRSVAALQLGYPKFCKNALSNALHLVLRRHRNGNTIPGGGSQLAAQPTTIQVFYEAEKHAEDERDEVASSNDNHGASGSDDHSAAASEHVEIWTGQWKIEDKAVVGSESGDS